MKAHVGISISAMLSKSLIFTSNPV